MSSSNIFELRKKCHLILMITAPLYIILSFIPSLDRYFFVFQLILFVQALTLIAQAIAGFVRLREPRELLRVFLALFISIASLCVGGISNAVLINNIPAWLYIYYFVGYLPAFVTVMMMSRVYSYKRHLKTAVNILAVLGIICCFEYFFAMASYNKFIELSLPLTGNNFIILSIATVEILFQICLLTETVPLFCSRDKNSISEY